MRCRQHYLRGSDLQMRPAPIVPIPKTRETKHSGAEQRFSSAARNRADARLAGDVDFTPGTTKPTARRRIKADHAWYRGKLFSTRLPKGASK